MKLTLKTQPRLIVAIHRAVIACIIALAGALLPLSAATDTYSGGSTGFFSSTTDFPPTAVASGDDLIFGANANATVTVYNSISDGFNLSSITFNNGGTSYTLAGNSITLGIGDGATTLENSSGATQTLGFTDANPSNGGIVLTTPTYQVFDATSGSTTVINSSVDLNGNSLVTTGDGTIIFNGDLLGSTATYSASLYAGLDNGTNGNVELLGAKTIAAGAGAAVALVTGTLTIDNNGSLGTDGLWINSFGFSGSGTPTLATLSDANNNTPNTGAVTLDNLVRIDQSFNINPAGPLTFNGSVLLSTTSTITNLGTGSNTVTFAGVVSGGASLILDGNGDGGQFNLTNANTYTGFFTELQDGVTVAVGDNSAFSTSTVVDFGADDTLTTTGAASSIVLNNNIWLFNNTSNLTATTTSGSTPDLQLNGVIFGSGNLSKLGSGTLYLTNNNTYSGGTFFGPSTGPSNTGAGTVEIGNGATTGVNNTAATSLSITPFGSALVTVNAPTTLTTDDLNAYTVSNSLLLNKLLTVNVAGLPLTLGGDISGASGVTKTGAGTMVYAGAVANTYTGLTTISVGEVDLNKTAGVNAITGSGGLNIASPDVLVNGGTLKWLANNQVADDATISMTSGTVSLNGFTETLGDFSNSGGTFTTGVGGDLIGTGASITWSGGTNTVNADATVEDSHVVITGGTNTVQGLSGLPAGTTRGGILQVDTGGLGLQMTGANLTLNSDAVSAGELLLQSGVAVTTFASSTTASVTSGGVAPNPGFVDLSGGTSTFTIASGTTATGVDMRVSAKIQDGSLTKAGAGTLLLTGANTYSNTTISAGTLMVGNNNGSHLSTALGTGSVINNSRLESTASLASPTVPMTINVGTNYTQGAGGTLLLQVATASSIPTVQAEAGTRYDTLAVAGTASVAGTLDLNFQNTSSPAQGQRYVAVTAGTPFATQFNPTVLTGNINPNMIALTTYNDTFGGTVSANSAVVTIMAPLTSLQPLTPNQTAVANNVDLYLLSAASNNVNLANTDFFDNVITGLNASSVNPGDLGRALDELSPQRLQVMRNIAFDNNAFDVQSWDNQMARERDGQFGVNGFDTSGLSFTDNTLGPQLSQIKSRLLAWMPATQPGLLSDVGDTTLGGMQMTDAKDLKAEREVLNGVAAKQWNAFIDGGADFGDVKHNIDTAHASYTTGRVRAGADFRVSSNIRVGALFGYAHTDADVDHEGSKVKVDSYTPGLYAAYADHSGFYANGLFTYTRNDYSSHRRIVFSGVDRTADGSTSGDQFGINADGGYEFRTGGWVLGPSLGLTYVNLGVDSFSETGAGSASLNVNSQSLESLRTRLGGTVRYQGKVGSAVLTPHFDAFWQHEYLNGSQGITGQFEVPGISPFTISSTNPGRDSALLGVGLDADLNDMVTLFIEYQAMVGASDFFGQSADGGVKLSF